jgi:diguanylate cyclase (GGDEF)-like protein/PAS domain S-box-containing protein
MTAMRRSSAGEINSLQGQLLHYAKDLQLMVEQHSKLQDNYRMLLQSVGRPVPSADQLPLALLASTPLYVVTDSDGVIVRSSAAASTVFRKPGTPLRGESLLRLVAPEHHKMVRTLLAKMEAASAPGGIEQRSLSMVGRVPVKVRIAFELLAMQIQLDGRREICWFLKQTKPAQTAWLANQERFLKDVSGGLGLMVTDPYGAIQFTNLAFCESTGYSSDELQSNNPRILGSGLQGAAYYQDFWLELLERGHWCGEIFNRRKGGQVYLAWQTIRMVEDVNNKVVSYIAATTDLTLRESITTDMVGLSYLDPLTGLPARTLFEDRLARAILAAAHHQSELCVLSLDLDQFKHINDEYGHAVGDQILREIGTRLKACVPHGDAVARVGGDEFLVLLHQVAGHRGAAYMARRLIDSIRLPIKLNDQTLTVSASIGGAIYPDTARDPSALLENAEAAMYSAKLSSAGILFFKPEIATPQKPRMATEIWRAVERVELELQYQPQIAINGPIRFRGCEALLRWRHPDLGDIDPLVFIPLAEQNGAIASLGNWALSKACHQLREWNSHGLDDFVMSVNVSLAQLRDSGFAGFVRQCLAETAIPARALELDLTETSQLQFEPSDRPLIETLAQLGVRIAVSDSGAAFSCLSRLDNPRVSSLKMNTDFVEKMVHDPEARSICKCMIALGSIMEMDVIAVGVESAEQAQLLAEMGCTLIQGFISGRPKSGAALLQIAMATQALPTDNGLPSDTWQPTLH